METVEDTKAEIEAEEKVEVETEEFDVGERDIGLTYDSIEEKFMAISELGLVQSHGIANGRSSGWYIQELYPSLHSKNKTLVKGCGKGTFQGSYGYPLQQCLNYYKSSANSLLKSKKYECNSTHMMISTYSDSFCSHLKYTNMTTIHCTQQCSSGGYPSYSGAYRLQVGNSGSSDCSVNPKTYYYIEMQDVCQYTGYNQSFRISYPNYYTFNNANCGGFGMSSLATRTTTSRGNLSVGCFARDYGLIPANDFAGKHISFTYPGSVVSNGTGDSSKSNNRVVGHYPLGLTYGEIIGWALAFSICFTCCFCCCLIYCILTFCPWCCVCLLGNGGDSKAKSVFYHGTVHYRRSGKHVEKPYDPNAEVTRPVERIVHEGAEDGEYVEDDGAAVEDDRPVGTDQTGINLVNQFAYEDDDANRGRYNNSNNNTTSYYSQRGRSSRYEMASDGYGDGYSEYGGTEYYYPQQQQSYYAPQRSSGNYASQYSMSTYEDQRYDSRYSGEHRDFDVYV